MKTIIYYAPNSTMGDTSNADCDSFRDWALCELEREYPDHDCDVSDTESTQSVYTDDEKNREEINDFCSRLWGNCPWDWLD